MGLEDGRVDQEVDVSQISTNAECLLYNGPFPVQMLALLWQA